MKKRFGWLLPLMLVNSAVSAGPPTVARGDALDHWRLIEPFPLQSEGRAVAAGNGRFVILNAAGDVAVTSDTKTWKTAELPFAANESKHSIAFEHGRFIVRGYADQGPSWHSVDGFLWEKHPATPRISLRASDGRNWLGATRASSFDSLSENDKQLYTSSNRVAWQTLDWSPPAREDLHSITGVTHGKGQWLISTLENVMPSEPLGGVVYASADLTNWTRTVTGELRFNDLAFGGNLWVGVNRDFLAWSEDGLTWTKVTFEGDRSLELDKVFYDDPHWLTTGSHGLFTSLDGKHWKTIINFFSDGRIARNLAKTKFGWIAYGNLIASSVNGRDWTFSYQGTNTWFSKHLETDNEILLFGAHGETVFIARSNDLIHWTRIPAEPASIAFIGSGTGGPPIANHAYQNGILLGIADQGYMARLAEGQPWEEISGGAVATFTRSKFVDKKWFLFEQWLCPLAPGFQVSGGIENWPATKRAHSLPALAAIASDGEITLRLEVEQAVYDVLRVTRLYRTTIKEQVWSEIDIPKDQDTGWSFEARDLEYANQRWVLGGAWFNFEVLNDSFLPSFRVFRKVGVLTSTDGIRWEVAFAYDTPASTFPGMINDMVIEKVFYANGQWVARATEALFISEDGASWRAAHPAPAALMAMGEGGWLAVDRYSDDASRAHRVFFSADATQWRRVDDFPFAGQLKDLAFGGGIWIVIGENGLLATSPDGINWDKRNSGYHGTLYSISFGDGCWVATGDQGAVLRSDYVEPRLRIARHQKELTVNFFGPRGGGYELQRGSAWHNFAAWKRFDAPDGTAQFVETATESAAFYRISRPAP